MTGKGQRYRGPVELSPGTREIGNWELVKSRESVHYSIYKFATQTHVLSIAKASTGEDKNQTSRSSESTATYTQTDDNCAHTSARQVPGDASPLEL